MQTNIMDSTVQMDLAVSKRKFSENIPFNVALIISSNSSKEEEKYSTLASLQYITLYCNNNNDQFL